MLRGRAAPRWLWITPVPDDDIIRKKNLTFNRAGIECTLSDHVFCLDNGEGLIPCSFDFLPYSILLYKKGHGTLTLL
jgi:hypothetical protein